MSDNEAGDSGPDEGYNEAKVVPLPPPPKASRGPETPESRLLGKMKLAIHKIGGKKMPPPEMAKLWNFADDENYQTVISSPEIQQLLSDKLRHCAALGNVNSLRFLHDKGGDINGQEEFTGNTPLMMAVQVTEKKNLEKQKQVITYLMEHGADCNIRNKYDMTPKSAVPGFQDSPSVLLVRELDLRIKDREKAKNPPKPVDGE